MPSQAPLSKEALAADVARELNQRLGGGLDEKALRAIGAAVAGHLADSARGTKAGIEVLLWAIFSAAYEGVYPQEAVDAFFQEVSVNPAKMFQAWVAAKEAWKQEGKAGKPRFSVLLIPGTLADGDPELVARSLFIQRQKDSSEPGGEPRQ